MTERSLNRFELLRNVHHAFNIPLNSIFNLTDLILLDLEGQDRRELREDIVALAAEAHALNHAIVLALELITFDDTALQPADLDLGQLVRMVVQQAQAAGQNIEHRLQLVLPDELPGIRGDVAAIQQVVMRLIAFAVQVAAPETVMIWVKPSADSVIFSIGQGSHEPDPACEPTVELPPEWIKDSSSMMILYCARVIRAHRGQLWASQSPENNVRINFSLPILPQLQKLDTQVVANLQ